MSETPSTMKKLGSQAPDFSLPSRNGKTVSLSDFKEKPVLAVFICNHCPYVLHIANHFSEQAREYQERGIAVVAISANDVDHFPQDAPDKMTEFASEYNFTFPYLYDESQDTAKAYQAACTPDFFLYDEEHKLFYRGQYDSSRPGNKTPVTGEDLNTAVDALLSGKPAPAEQKPSSGCNIKWKPGNEPGFFKIG
ncbi:MAG: thioredoxin family protein [Spirochaetales bacterium]|nr:thioredoxin family protein [Spirochaetales bacterium]MCF7939723.1 thioredoxin family protein [Spirochaetales bacterium]